jgi:hypothetical protein
VAYLNASQQSVSPRRLSDQRLASIKALPLVQSSLQKPALWGLGLGSFALGLVNGSLVIAAGISWVAYKQLLSLSPQQWAVLKQQIEQLLPLPRSLRQQALVLSILLGASTYTMVSLWQATRSPLMAVVLTSQTALTLLVVGFLLRSGGPAQSAKAPASQKSMGLALPQAMEQIDPVEQSLGQLGHPEPLKRLVAVRRLVKLMDAMGDDPLYVTGAEVSLRSHLLDCFHIMLAHESEPIVRSAVREGLNLLRQTHQLPAGPGPFPPIPDHQESQAALPKKQRSAVEYVEYLEP